MYYTYRNKELGVIVLNDDEKERFFQRLLEKNHNSNVNGFLETIFFTKDNFKFSYDLDNEAWVVYDFLNTKIIELRKDAKKYYELRNKK